MNIETAIDNAQGGATIDNLANAFGVDRTAARNASHFLMQEIAHRIERMSISRGGLADTIALVGDTAAGRALIDPHHLSDPAIIATGDHVLDVLIGDKHVSRGIAARAANASGLDVETAKKFLPVVASMVIGALQKETRGVFSKKLRDLPGLGNMSVDIEAQAGGGKGVVSRAVSRSGDDSAGGWGLDLPNIRSSGGVGGTTGTGVLLPLPGDNIPGVGQRNRYDDLSDVIRKGPVDVPGTGGSSLEGIVRSVLGNLLGFGNRGVIGSLIRVLIARWGWRILQRILSRVLTGR